MDYIEHAKRVKCRERAREIKRERERVEKLNEKEHDDGRQTNNIVLELAVCGKLKPDDDDDAEEGEIYTENYSSGQ